MSTRSLDLCDSEKEILGVWGEGWEGKQGPNFQNKAALANYNVFHLWVEISQFGNLLGGLEALKGSQIRVWLY